MNKFITFCYCLCLVAIATGLQTGNVHKVAQAPGDQQGQPNPEGRPGRPPGRGPGFQNFQGQFPVMNMSFPGNTPGGRFPGMGKLPEAINGAMTGAVNGGIRGAMSGGAPGAMTGAISGAIEGANNATSA